jgi:phage baseplate assembly protein W
MCEKTGKWLYDDDALEQSIRRILKTPKGSQVLNRTFGSQLFKFVDKPLTEIRAHMSHEIFRSLGEQLPGFKIEKIEFVDSDEGEFFVEIFGNGCVGIKTRI